MKKLLIVPERDKLQECLDLAKGYGLGFEYNDFYDPDLLDNGHALFDIIDEYRKAELPEYCTLHGAFLDVVPFSADKKIQKMSNLRIEESLGVARRIGAETVIFHTNYNPFLSSEGYVEKWIDANELYWKRILEENKKINIYLENMFDLSPDILVRLAERLSKYENFGVCLDWAHATLSKVDPVVWAEKLGKYIKHIHLNDNDLEKDLHLAWGDGKIDRAAFYEAYNKYLQGATVLIETSSMENKIRSLDVLKKEGFLED